MSEKRERTFHSDLPPSKMAKVTKKIATHSGQFHCDEAFACWMLQNTTEFAGAEIVRTRTPEVIDACDIVVDVGGVYDHERKRYDHHQRTFNETLDEDHATKLSSAGLIYKHYGAEVIRNVLSTEDEGTVSLLYDKMYKKFVEAIDAVDNGIAQYEGEPKYEVSTTLPSRVKLLNPSWNEETSEEQTLERFRQASQLTGSEFLALLNMYAASWIPARNIVEQSIKDRKEVDESGRIVLLSQRCPWGDHLATLEKELGLEGDQSILYVVFGDGNDWRVQAVPVSPGSFESRLALEESWRGVRDDELSAKTGIEGCVFVHASGFIGGTRAKETALQLARLSIAVQSGK